MKRPNISTNCCPGGFALFGRTDGKEEIFLLLRIILEKMMVRKYGS
jgi:hypothetical protein